MADKTFVFDLDDTLIPNQHLYNLAIVDFQRYILEKTGYRSPHPQTIVNLFVEMDVNAVKKLGFSIRRFPETFVETFQKVSEIVGYHCTEEDLREVHRIGTKAFDIKPGLLDGAEMVLDFLAANDDELLLYTKGDAELQQKKIDLSEIQRWFTPAKTYIVKDKNSADLETIVRDRNKDKTFKVGNSIRSDVNPALAIGIKAIYIPCDTWAYETKGMQFDKTNPRLFIFSDIKEIIANYGRL
jgi:putative hydrolase of the HAD superfamily